VIVRHGRRSIISSLRVIIAVLIVIIVLIIIIHSCSQRRLGLTVIVIVIVIVVITIIIITVIRSGALSGDQVIVIGRVVSGVVFVVNVAIDVADLMSIPVGKSEGLWHALKMSELTNTGYSIVRHGQLHPSISWCEAAPRQQRHKVVTTLFITRLSKADRTNGSGFHPICVLLMSLDVGTELKADVFPVV
jgi:hypothetical protein